MAEPNQLTQPMLMSAQVSQADALAIVVHGASKSGKTYFAGTAPNPLIISSIAERGFVSVIDEEHPQAAWIREHIWPIPEQDPTTGTPTGKGVQQSLLDACYWLQANYTQHNIKSVVVDNMTVLGDMVYAEMSGYGEHTITNKQKSNDQLRGLRGEDRREEEKRTWNHYTRYWEQIRDLLQSVPLNIVWVFNSKPIYHGNIVTSVGPAFKGKAALNNVILNTAQMLLYLDAYPIAVTPKDWRPTQEGEPPPTITQVIRRLWVRCPRVEGQPLFEAAVRQDAKFPEDCYVPSWENLAWRLRRQ